MMNHYTVINDRATRAFLVAKRDGNGEKDERQHRGCGKIQFLLLFSFLVLLEPILYRFLLYTVSGIVFGLLCFSDPLQSAKYTLNFMQNFIYSIYVG